MPRTLLFCLGLLLLPPVLVAQEEGGALRLGIGQTGLAIGIYNSAEVLKGVLIGLLNRAKNNRPPFRWLPLLNVSL